MSTEPETCGRCGQPKPAPSIREEPRVNTLAEDTKLCVECAQLRPYPTTPGNWRYRANGQTDWMRVKVVNEKGRLHVICGADKRHLQDFGDDSGQWQKQ